MQAWIDHLTPALRGASEQLAAGTVMLGAEVTTLHVPCSPLSIFLALVAASFTYGAGLVLYRLFLSPLARFPGPKLAAAFESYEFYYLIVKGGQWGNRVNDMHKKYGKRRLAAEFHRNRD